MFSMWRSSSHWTMPEFGLKWTELFFKWCNTLRSKLGIPAFPNGTRTPLKWIFVMSMELLGLKEVVKNITLKLKCLVAGIKIRIIQLKKSLKDIIRFLDRPISIMYNVLWHFDAWMASRCKVDLRVTKTGLGEGAQRALAKKTQTRAGSDRGLVYQRFESSHS